MRFSNLKKWEILDIWVGLIFQCSAPKISDSTPPETTAIAEESAPDAAAANAESSDTARETRAVASDGAKVMDCGPIRCSECRQLLDDADLVIYGGDPDDAVSWTSRFQIGFHG